MHSAILANETVTKLFEKADEICTKYAAAMAGDCEELVKAYGPNLIAQIGGYLADPAKVCGSIGMCSAPTEEDSKLGDNMILQALHSKLRMDAVQNIK
mmetsp:Transcript_15501/g.37525  ORF Transcript_15501/g.37525 Transcript_15501/m.37525 type:complete len:98 (-) Transcript_15501:1843-2136(-)